MTDMKTVAGTVSTVDEAVMQALPFISGLLAFIPGAQVALPFMPLVNGGLMALDTAAKAVAAGNPPGTPFPDIMKQVTDHLTPGKPNSPILSQLWTQIPSQDPSAQGSG